LDEAKRQAIQELETTKREAERQLGCQRMNYEQQLKQMGTTLVSRKGKSSNMIQYCHSITSLGILLHFPVYVRMELASLSAICMIDLSF
jgi:hypothetical protein